MNDKEWIDRLRQEEQEYEAPAPDGLWDDIDKELTPMLSHKKHMTMPVWVRLGGVAAAVALMLGVGSIFLFHNDSPQSEHYSNIKPVTDGNNNTNNPSCATTIPSNLLAHANIFTAPHSESLEEATAVMTNENAIDDIDEIPVIGTDTTSTVDTSDLSPKNLASNRDHHETREYHESKYDYKNIITQKGKNISLSVYAGNMAMNSNSVQSGYGPVADLMIPGDDDIAGTPVGSDPATDIVISNQGEDVETKTTHRLPIRFGVNVSIPVYDNLSVETGLTYSILSSTTKSGTKANLFDTEQSLHYIGIPLKATYNIWDSKSFGFYVTAGGMIEKCVYGRGVTDFIIGNEIASSETEKIMERQFQFSIMTGVGIKWNITKTVNLFAEPGVGYYINNHSDVINSYKDKPFNFDLKIGLRFNLNP